jgi:4'-phosphopantetheinyl transferase
MLNPGLLYLWTARTDVLRDIGILSELQALLSAEEQIEARGFRRDRDRHQFLIARGLLRAALSEDLPVSTTDWRFGRNNNGKPFIAAPESLSAVNFSLSHTEGQIACLISLAAEAAVDVEKVEYHDDLTLVAKQVMSGVELTALGKLSGKDWTERFFACWTLKEAYAKARGQGLRLVSSDVGFEIEPDNAIRPHFASTPDDRSAWIFWHRHLSSHHTISIAAKKESGREFKIIHRSLNFGKFGSHSMVSREKAALLPDGLKELWPA